MDEQRQVSSVAPSERELASARSLGRAMARAYREAVDGYRRHLFLTLEEADGKALEPADEAFLERLNGSAPEHVSWWDVNALVERDPDLAAEVLEQVRVAARDELDSGHRAAQAFDLYSSLWEQSRFMAIREAFRQEWLPRGGIEDALLDTLAQAYSCWQTWLNRLHWRSELESRQSEPGERPYWKAPTISDVEAVREAAEMADRFHRMFMRTLRALREHRRYAPAVVVHNAGQVNVAGRQVNQQNVSR